MVKLIAHIGEAKTGSTSIQEALHTSHRLLLASKIAYCATDTSQNHNDLRGLLGEHVHFDFTDPRVERQAREKIEDMRRLSDSVDFILLSSEPLLELGPEELDRITDLIGIPFEETAIVFYVRDPVERYLSLIKQLLLTRSTFPAPDRYRIKTPRMLARWRGIYGADRIWMSPYAPAAFEGGDVVSDFAARLGQITGRPVALPAGMRRNRSLSSEQIAVLQEFRGQVLPDFEKRVRPDAMRVLLLLEDLADLGMPGEKPGLSEEAQTALIRGNLGRLQRLSADYPELGFAPPADPGSGAPDTQPWHGDPSVLSILGGHDFAVLELYRRIILGPRTGAPVSDAGWVAEMLEEVCDTPDLAGRVAGRVARYWRETGEAGRADLMERPPSKA